MPGTSTTQQPLPSQPYHASHITQSIQTQHRPTPLTIPMSSHGFTPGNLCALHFSMIVAHVFSGRIAFKDSPFYTILEQLTPTVECKSEH